MPGWLFYVILMQKNISLQSTQMHVQKKYSLKSNPSTELLFCDHRKLTQIRVKATCITKQKDDLLFAQQHEQAQKITPALCLRYTDKRDGSSRIYP